MKTFAHNEVAPSWWANAADGFLFPFVSPNFILRKVAGSDTTVEVPAAAGEDRVSVAIDGLWRWNVATVNRAVTGGTGAGTLTVWACTGPQAIDNIPVAYSDHTVYSWVLRITAGAAPAVEAGVVEFWRAVGTLTWDGAKITAVKPAFNTDAPADGSVSRAKLDPAVQGMLGAGIQAGVEGDGGLVTRLNAATARVAAGTAWVPDASGLLIRLSWPQTDLALPAAAAGQARVDQIIVDTAGTGLPVRLAGAAGAAAGIGLGATRAASSAALPATAIRLADLSIDATGLPVTATNNRDRRRRAYGAAVSATESVAAMGNGGRAASRRVELSGAPCLLHIRAHGELGGGAVAGATADLHLRDLDNGDLSLIFGNGETYADGGRPNPNAVGVVTPLAPVANGTGRATGTAYLQAHISIAYQFWGDFFWTLVELPGRYNGHNGLA